MIRSVDHEKLPLVTGVCRVGGLPAFSVRHMPTRAVIDDEAPVGEHVMFLVVATEPDAAPVIAERVAELLRRHGLADVPESAEGLG